MFFHFHVLVHFQKYTMKVTNLNEGVKFLCISCFSRILFWTILAMKSCLIYSQYTLAVLTKAITETQPALLLQMWPRTRSCVALPKGGRGSLSAPTTNPDNQIKASIWT